MRNAPFQPGDLVIFTSGVVPGFFVDEVVRVMNVTRLMKRGQKPVWRVMITRACPERCLVHDKATVVADWLELFDGQVAPGDSHQRHLFADEARKAFLKRQGEKTA